MAEEVKVLNYYTVVLEGIDKSGKDTIASYIWNLDKRLNVWCRGWPSLYVYNEKFKRNTIYALPPTNFVFVRLNVNKTDWQIRCKLTNEPEINYDKDSTLFDYAFGILTKNNYKCYTFNTSRQSPYDIAKTIISIVKRLNKEDDDVY